MEPIEEKSNLKWKELSDKLIENIIKLSKDDIGGKNTYQYHKTWYEPISLTIYDTFICHFLCRCKLPQKVYTEENNLRHYLSKQILDPGKFVSDSIYRSSVLLGLRSEIDAHVYNIGHSVFYKYDSKQQLYIKLKIEEVLKGLDKEFKRNENKYLILHKSEIEGIIGIARDFNLVPLIQLPILKIFFEMKDDTISKEEIELTNLHYLMGFLLQSIDTYLHKAGSEISYRKKAGDLELFIPKGKNKKALNNITWSKTITELNRNILEEDFTVMKEIQPFEEQIKKVLDNHH